MYNIIDNQGTGHMQNRDCETIKDVIDNLASYHSVDFSDEIYGDDIYKWLDTMSNDIERLNALLEYGDWDIEKV
jgi:hypothetical protein